MLNSERLGLGTVQWGMSYGIANQSGLATSDTVKTILQHAQDANVKMLDTAWAYGNAEGVLGEHNCLANGFDIVTKTQPLKGMSGTPEEKAEQVEKSFHLSLKQLGGNHVYGLLVHHADDLLGKAGKAIWSRLSRLKQEGFIKKIGCSLYSPDQLSILIDLYDLDIVQLPYNIYDQRFTKSGLAKQTEDIGIEVHARSAFLQGLLLMPPEKLPTHFSSLVKHHAALWKEYTNLEVSPLEAALGFSLSCSSIDKVIVGCEQVSQWNEILKISNDSLPQNVISKLELFAIENEDFINPSRWVK